MVQVPVSELGRLKDLNKAIHYFWFGGADKGKVIEKCIASWAKFFPDFEIKEWNETNFDVRQNKYISQAYDAKKFAFVSDFARFKILHEQGGLYFDTDVEVIRAFYDYFELDAFAAFETEEFVAPGLVLWAKEPGNKMLSEILETYSQLEFINPDGSLNTVTICKYFTDTLKKHGLKNDDGTVQQCDSFSVFPREYFCPFDDLTGVMNKTEKTCAIHWYAKSWMSKKDIIRNRITRFLHRYLGVDFFRRGK